MAASPTGKLYAKLSNEYLNREERKRTVSENHMLAYHIRQADRLSDGK